MGLLPKRRAQERRAFEMYGAAVAAARDPWFYLPPPAGLGVADTLDGRFDLISLHAFLIIRRLRALDGPGPAQGAALAQGVFDAMFSDMDRSLREMGVGDLGVSRRVRAMWEAFHGRATAYDAALDAPDPALAEALTRNVWRGEATRGSERLARLVQAQAAALAEQDLLAGLPVFLPAGAV